MVTGFGFLGYEKGWEWEWLLGKAEGQDGRGLFRTNKLSLTTLSSFPASHLLGALGHVLC